MKLGVVFPQSEMATDAVSVRDFAQAAQDLGYDHLLTYDHVLGADPMVHASGQDRYTLDAVHHEPFVLFGYLAAVAPRLDLATCVLVLPQRQTALVAKQAAEVDVLSGGRLRLGIGIGRNAIEYGALGKDFRNRGRRLEEQVALLRKLWTEPSVTFDGEFERVVAAGINPMPLQRPIPVWIGGSSEPALRRAACLGDGVFLASQPVEGGWPAMLRRMRAWRAEAGQDPDRFGVEARIAVGKGSPDDWRRRAEDWRGSGASHLAVVSAGAGLHGVDAHVQRLREAREALG